jgi:hypothetical protein
MSIARGGDVVLEYRRLPRPSPKSVPASGGNVGGERCDDPWVRLLELAPGSQYRVPGDEALFGRHGVWATQPMQVVRQPLAARYCLVETSAF